MRREQGQVLPIAAFLLVVFLGLVGLAVDVGRLYVAKVELSRAVDAAALAGSLDMPDTAAAQADARAYLTSNLASASATFPAGGSSEFKVAGSRSLGLIFMRVFGFDSLQIRATATVGFGKVYTDAALLVDATGSMGATPCNGSQNNAGCPIKEAKDAASQFVNTLLGGAAGYTKVGYAPFRGCYNPPRTNSSCVPGSAVIDLTTNASTLQTGINATSAVGGNGTNICLAFYQGQQILNGPNRTTSGTVRRALVILSDGDNTYNAAAYGQGQPPSACRPATDPTRSDSDVSSNCLPAQTRERELDAKALALTDQVKAQGVEIYVVGFGVCGTANTSKPNDPGYCNGVGNSDHDNAADRRLLKCVASSTPGTNDHYFEVASASDLPAVFGQIARLIGFRITE